MVCAMCDEYLMGKMKPQIRLRYATPRQVSQIPQIEKKAERLEHRMDRIQTNKTVAKRQEYCLAADTRRARR